MLVQNFHQTGDGWNMLGQIGLCRKGRISRITMFFTPALARNILCRQVQGGIVQLHIQALRLWQFGAV